MRQPIQLSKGDKFGRLIVVKLSRKAGKRTWKCECSCGNIVYTGASNLTHNVITSCGCKKRDHLISMTYSHGDSKSPEHKVWENMIIRCTNEKAWYYKHYGARGIRVCDRWRNNYEAFLEDMGRRPSDKHELDRIDNDGNYEPGNCRWATRKQQLNNRRGNVKVTIDGVTKTLAEWSEVSGIGRNVIQYRLKVGRSSRDAVFARKFCKTAD